MAAPAKRMHRTDFILSKNLVQVHIYHHLKFQREATHTFCCILNRVGICPFQNPVKTRIFQKNVDFRKKSVFVVKSTVFHEKRLNTKYGQNREIFKQSSIKDLKMLLLHFGLRTTHIVASEGRRNGHCLSVFDVNLVSDFGMKRRVFQKPSVGVVN